MLHAWVGQIVTFYHISINLADTTLFCEARIVIYVKRLVYQALLSRCGCLFNKHTPYGKFSKSAATRRVALRAALLARITLVWSTKMGRTPDQMVEFPQFLLRDGARGGRRRRILVCV